MRLKQERDTAHYQSCEVNTRKDPLIPSIPGGYHERSLRDSLYLTMLYQENSFRRRAGLSSAKMWLFRNALPEYAEKGRPCRSSMRIVDGAAGDPGDVTHVEIGTQCSVFLE